MPSTARQRHGSLGEQAAAEHLGARGYAILARNYRTRYGELDLVAADARALVFCEVKSRRLGTRAGAGTPLEAIGPRKRRRLRLMAAQWLAARGADADRPVPPQLRFDAIGVTLGAGGAVLALDHVEDAF